MLRSIRSRMLITYLLLVVLPMGLLGWFMLHMLNRFYVERLQDDMSVEVRLISSAIADEVAQGLPVEANSILNDSAPALQSQARILVFDADAQLIASSDRSFNGLLNHALDEPGLQDALSGYMARGIEISQASGVPIAYVTQPIFRGPQVIGAVHMSYSLDQIQDAQRELQVLIIGVVIAMALIVSVFSVQLAQLIRRPLMRVALAAARIADGDLTQRVMEEAPSEVAMVAHNFNRMAEALQTVEQARNATFANIAHDVRTPIGSMRAAAEALLSGAVDQPELCMRLLNGITTQAQYLSRLSDDLLRLATYEAGGLVLRRSSVSLSNLIEEALHGFEARALAHDICVKLDLPLSLPDVYVDGDRVLEILFNLLDNALSYTSAHGWIRVSARHDTWHGVVWVHVCDSGPGIPQDILPHVFERYWRGEYRRDTIGLHMGLGLSIAHEIVKAHGGKISATNCAEGGADFFFCLPVFDHAVESSSKTSFDLTQA